MRNYQTRSTGFADAFEEIAIARLEAQRSCPLQFRGHLDMEAGGPFPIGEEVIEQL